MISSRSAFVRDDVELGQPNIGSNSSKRGATGRADCCGGGGGGGGGGFATKTRRRAAPAIAWSSFRFSGSMSATNDSRIVSYTTCAWEGNEVRSNRSLATNVRKS